jgi:hypothetical protein
VVKFCSEFFTQLRLLRLDKCLGPRFVLLVVLVDDVVAVLVKTDAHVFLGLLQLHVDSVLELFDLLLGPLLNDIGLLKH